MRSWSVATRNSSRLTRNLTRQNDDLDEARKKNEENYKRAASAIASLFQTRAKEAYRRSQPIVALDYGRAALANAVVAGEMPIGLAEILTDSLGASRVVT